MTMLQTFQQFFTPKKYSQVMIESLEIEPPKKIIDLAVGEGSLLIEAILKWDKSSYFGNDIDPNCCQQISKNYSGIRCYNYDIFLISSINNIISEIGKVDLCIGNPPFHLIKQDSDIREILKQFKLDKMYKSEYIPSEVPFILQSFRILEENGTLALILPDGFFTTKYLKYFRQFLLNNYQIDKIIELPHKIFEKTHAKTHILILKNSKPTKSTVLLTKIDENCIKISFSDAIERMDYNYYKNKQISEDTIPLSELDVMFLRGKPKFRMEGIDVKHILHTTNFKKGNLFQNKLRTINKFKNTFHIIAIPGDIVLSRVGTSSVGKVGIVSSGYFLTTDCIFLIRTKNIKLRNIIYRSLTSTEGQQWIQAHAKGVAARHITLEEIKKFPIENKDINGI